MCGICGVFQIGGEPRRLIAPDTLDAMTDVMIHRGPNDRGVVSGPGFALGARRLSIVDVEAGHQPVANESGLIRAVQNGELYNHAEIHDRLVAAGHALHTRCDTEILPHLFEEVGNEVPERLRGKFAVAIWDEERRRGLLARDRLGVKPLYYSLVGDRVVFGSELKSVLASGIVPLDLDYEAIDLFLSLGYMPAPYTPLLAVKKLPPGHRLVVDEHGARTEEYWAYPLPDEEHPVWGEDEYAERLLAEVDDAVQSRLMSDVPLGAMLSGGLDSSLVLALMARRTAGAVKTFTVGFSEVPSPDVDAAREVARHFGADHHTYELSIGDPIDLPALVWALDEPLADLSTLGFGALSELAARHVTVALSGQGADELLAGYERYQQLAMLERWSRAPRALRRAAVTAARVAPARIRRATRVALDPDPLVASVTARSEWAASMRATTALGGLAAVPSARFEDVLRTKAGAPAPGLGLERALRLDANLSLADDMLHYFDRTSMAHSLEVRVPFLDHKLVEFCARIPASLKLKDGMTKYLLRRVARGIVPDTIIDRPKVGFFDGAVERWFDAQLSGVVGDVLLDPGARYTELLDRSSVLPLVTSASSDRRHAKLLLSVLMLEFWLSHYLPRALGARGSRPQLVAV